MTALEIRLIGWGLAALLFLGGTAWATYRLTANHYEAVAEAKQLAEDKALSQAQQAVIAAQNSQAQAVQASEAKYVDLQNRYDGLSKSLSDSVRSYTQLHSGIVSQASATASLADAARKSADSATELGNLVRQASEACLSDSATLTALQEWAKDVSK